METISGEILPVMLPLMGNKEINYDQFTGIMRTIRSMLQRVEAARLEALGQKAALDSEVATDASNIMAGKGNLSKGVTNQKLNFDQILGVKTNDTGFADFDVLVTSGAEALVQN